MGIELQCGCPAKKVARRPPDLAIRARVSIHVYCESFSVLARLRNFPTPVVLASALCPSPLPPSLPPTSSSHPCAPSHLPLSFSADFSFQSDSSCVGSPAVARKGGWGEESRDCWTFLFFLQGGYLEDGARCYGVSAEMFSLVLSRNKSCVAL